jgi:hypothetical protein
MTSKELEGILNECICMDLNSPHFMIVFTTKEYANKAQSSLFEYLVKGN